MTSLVARLKRSGRRRGFTLLEALLALVLATLLFAAVSLYTGTWLKQWSRLVTRGSQEDVVAIVLDRIVEDLEEAQPVYVKDAQGEHIIFNGAPQQVTFLRPALGFDARAGLDEVTYLNGSAGSQAAIIRSRRGFDPAGPTGAGEDLPLIRGNTRVEFTYSDANGAQTTGWNDPRRLPVLVKVEISGSMPRPWRQFAYARLRVEMPAYCGTAASFPSCKARLGG